MTATRLQILAFKARYAKEWNEYVSLVAAFDMGERRNELFNMLVAARKELELHFYIVDEAEHDARKL